MLHLAGSYPKDEAQECLEALGKALQNLQALCAMAKRRAEDKQEKKKRTETLIQRFSPFLLERTGFDT